MSLPWLYPRRSKLDTRCESCEFRGMPNASTVFSNACTDHRRIFWLLSIATSLAAPLCPSNAAETRTPAQIELHNLGHYSFRISTNSREAQRAFDRGLTLAYGFGHYAAEQEFRRAIASDSNCAMAWWGIALVNGPHINFPIVPPDKAATAWEALGKAQALAGQTTPLEQSLIAALSKRYANPQPEDRSPLDTAYAGAMRTLWQTYPDNADIGTLFAEAAMDLHPWDLWNKDASQPWTPEIVTTLERVLQINSRHPGANHLYIHVTEASPQPEKGIPSADRLRHMVPDASHLVHMPAHIYARVDRWPDAATANREAMKADVRYRAAYPRPGLYAIYMAHNAHFLSFVAMMRGRSEEALQCARTMVAEVPDEFLKEYAPIADGYMIIVSETLMRFGRWQEVLAAPEPRPELPLSRALWRYTRTSALTALNRMGEAASEKAAFQQAVKAVPANWQFGNNSAADILAIAGRVIDGEIAAKAGQSELAISALQDAVRLEDNLRYDEPPDWIQPVRHTLGAVLLKAGKTAHAEKVYREDLVRYPGNGWSLLGLRDALAQQGKKDEARLVGKQFQKAWADADIQPTFTCYCQQNN
jgi:tetratricopeptide (TPR) repeat protein